MDGKKTESVSSFPVRTDLALENRESFEGDGGEVSGVALREWVHKKSRVKLTEVKILNSQGAQAMGKPMGTYLTLEANQLLKEDEEYHSQIAGELAAGNIDADPYWRSPEVNACRYCEYGDACHFEECCGDKIRRRRALSAGEFWALLKEKGGEEHGH